MRRCGANCSARSGAANSLTTGLCVSVGAHSSPMVGLLFSPLRSILVNADIGLVLVMMMMLAGCSGGTVLVDSAVDMENHPHAAMVPDAATVVPFNFVQLGSASVCSIAPAVILSNISFCEFNLTLESFGFAACRRATLPIVRRFVWRLARV